MRICFHEFAEDQQKTKRTTAITTQEPTGSLGWSATSSSVSGRTGRSWEWSRSYQAHAFCSLCIRFNIHSTQVWFILDHKQKMDWIWLAWASGLIELWNILMQRHARSLLKTGRNIMKFFPFQVLESFLFAVPVERMRKIWALKTFQRLSKGFQHSRAHLLKRMHGAPRRPQSSFEVESLHLGCEMDERLSQYRSNSMCLTKG